MLTAKWSAQKIGFTQPILVVFSHNVVNKWYCYTIFYLTQPTDNLTIKVLRNSLNFEHILYYINLYVKKKSELCLYEYKNMETYRRKTPPNREAFKHSGGDSLL